MFSLGGGVHVSLMISSYATGRLESLLNLRLPKRKQIFQLCYYIHTFSLLFLSSNEGTSGSS